MRKTTRWSDHASDLTNGLDATLRLSTPRGEAGLIPIGDDVAGDVTTTAVLTIGAPATVNTIETIGDLDFYKVTLEAGKTYEFDLFGKAGGPNLAPLSDSYLELYDTSGDLIVAADGGASTTTNTVNSGFDAILTYTATTSGTYYVNARAFDNVPDDGTNGDLVGDYELSARDVTSEPRYVPYYSPESPLYSIDWGVQVDGTVRNPDGAETGHLTGNAQELPDDKGTGITGKNVITIYFAKAGDLFVSEDPTAPSLPPATVAVGAKDFELTAVWTALHEFEKVADVVYVETQDRAAADFEYFTYSGTPGPGVSLLGSMSPPQENDEGLALFNSGDYRWNATNLAQGGFSFVTLIHEFGHGHGLAHPHDNGGHSGIMNGVTSEGAVADYTLGDYELNQAIYTMMSYEDGWQTSPYGNAETDVGYGYLGGLMAFDIAAIQDKYGVNEEWATGDDTYTLSDVNAAGTYYTSIWDAGGRDRITYAGDKDAVIELRPATLQYEYGGGGFVSYAYGVFGGFTIADGVTIERARAGSGDDILVGNDARNLLDGGAGADVIDGGAGSDRLIGHGGRDTASFLLAERGVRVDLTAEGAQNTHAGRDALVSIENVTGSHHDDRLTGGDGRNDLFGSDGDDVLSGGAGADLLTGGAGVDRLFGGGGADIFAFADGDVGATKDTADRILQFAARDGIDVSGIDAVAGTVDVDDAFTFIGAAAFGNVAGELQLVTYGYHFQLSGDTDGDGAADFVIIGTGVAPLADAIVL